MAKIEIVNARCPKFKKVRSFSADFVSGEGAILEIENSTESLFVVTADELQEHADEESLRQKLASDCMSAVYAALNIPQPIAVNLSDEAATKLFNLEEGK